MIEYNDNPVGKKCTYIDYVGCVCKGIISYVELVGDHAYAYIMDEDPNMNAYSTTLEGRVPSFPYKDLRRTEEVQIDE